MYGVWKGVLKRAKGGGTKKGKNQGAEKMGNRVNGNHAGGQQKDVAFFIGSTYNYKTQGYMGMYG